MIFVDASAFVSIIAGEADMDELSDRLETSDRRLCSAISIWETAAALCKTYQMDVPAARDETRRFIRTAALEFVSIGDHELELALEAYARFGKGRHPAALNMGDCFAYACAKANNAKLLYKGEDFSKTDMIAA